MGFTYLAFSLTGRHSRQSENGISPNHRKPQFAMTAWRVIDKLNDTVTSFFTLNSPLVFDILDVPHGKIP